MSLMPPNTNALKKTCDFCVRRKRSCDGFARRRCSFCIAKRQPECHYRPRRPRGPQPSGYDADATEALPPPRCSGRTFWPTDDETAPALTGGGGRSAQAGSRSGGERLLLPFERGKFSASPATGLIGLQENEFLSDFFGCLGFLSITSEGTVRRAMVSVMVAGASLQHQHHPGAPLPSHSSPGLVGGDSGGVRQGVGESSLTIGDSGWSNALAVENGSGALPRDPSTCVLWCAIAIGALVRGIPLDHVGRYADLAQDSARASYDGATLGTARAYVAMAFLHNFLGDQVKSQEYTKLTNSVVDALRPEEIPRGFRDLLQYAGFSRAIERKVAPTKDIQGYWENVPPIWQMSENVMERDICGLVLSVAVQISRPFSDETGAGRVVSAMQQRLSKVSPVATSPPIERTELHNAEVDRICLKNVEACEEFQKKSVLPEMLRLEEGIENSNMHLGLGGLLYYGNLSYLQLLNRDPAARSSRERCFRVLLRYPGLCRFNSWLHVAHTMFDALATFKSRDDYEALRASYNSTRPIEWRPAPPFEEWRGISDICDRPGCRRFVMRVRPLLLDYCRSAASTHDLETVLLL